MPIEKDRHGRWRIDLFGLPRWVLLLIAVAITSIVVATARFTAPQPVTPPWLADAIHLGGWVYLALVLFAMTSWLMRRRKR